MSEEEKISATVEQCLHVLGEYFSDVQVLASRVVEGRTHSISKGVGNWYARQGMAHEFLNEEVARENARKISDELKPEA